MSDTIKKHIKETIGLIRHFENHASRNNPPEYVIKNLNIQKRRLAMMRDIYEDDTTYLDEWELANDI